MFWASIGPKAAPSSGRKSFGTRLPKGSPAQQPPSEGTFSSPRAIANLLHALADAASRGDMRVDLAEKKLRLSTPSSFVFILLFLSNSLQRR